MPDTGAPWNIPYVDPTDLVRDYPQASEDLADAIADGLTAAGSAGIGANVVQAVKTDKFLSTSATFTTITGLSATITPSSDTAKVLVIAQISHGVGRAGDAFAFRIAGGNAGTYVGDADASRTRAVFGEQAFSDNFRRMQRSSSIVFLDAPATASPVTYTVEGIKTGGVEFTVNRPVEDSNQIDSVCGASSLTVIEVAV